MPRAQGFLAVSLNLLKIITIIPITITKVISLLSLNMLPQNPMKIIKLVGVALVLLVVSKHVTLVDGNSNDINISISLASNETGNLSVGFRLKGSAEYGTTITITNVKNPDKTYTKTITENSTDFEDIYVADNNNPAEYKIEVVDSDADPRFP